MKLLSDSLVTIYDRYVQQVLASYVMNREASQILNSIPKYNDQYRFAAKYVDIYIYGLTLDSLSLLKMYMSEQQLQTYNVAKDTMKYCGSDFMNMYLKKMQASRSINDNHSTLMSEVRLLLLNKPFGRYFQLEKVNHFTILTFS